MSDLISRLVNLLGKPIGVVPIPRAFPPSTLNAEVFEAIYEENHWGSSESRSGVGSEKVFARPYASRLVKLLSQLEAKSIFDAPCGDLNWFPEVLDKYPISYLGGDVSGIDA